LLLVSCLRFFCQKTCILQLDGLSFTINTLQMLYAINKNTASSSALERALNDLRQIIAYRTQTYLNGDGADFNVWLQNRFGENLVIDELQQYLPQLQSNEEWIILMMAIAPHVLPNFYESVIMEHLPNGGDFSEFGGVKATNHRGMLPTGETVQFILAGMQITERIHVQEYFSGDHFFYQQNVLWLESVKEGEPFMSGRLVLSQEWLHKLLTGKDLSPKFDTEFAARCITTAMEWDDLVLNNTTAEHVNDLKIWLQCNETVLNDAVLGRKIKPGFRVLFHGPSGTGKTLTATLLGKQFNKDVYRIDLSQVVSKFIGETEKNLEKVFLKAAHKDWILFFDEADALFGKRTNVQSSHDKYANQEVAYLLQRIEDFPGLIILASNLKSNMDDAFVRRFHSIIHFPAPNHNERLLLWQKTMPASLQPEPALNLSYLSEKYELNGAAILNVVHNASLRSVGRKDGYLRNNDIIDAIRKEFRKEERTMG